MSYSCSKCDFKAHFESALKMHTQLHHDSSGINSPTLQKKSNTMPREKEQIFPIKPKKSLRSLTRSSSATRLLDKIRVRLCKSRLFSHPEETEEQSNEKIQYKSPSKTEVKPEAALKVTHRKAKPIESFGCHLCSLEADRITILDRHLLNDHKIGMESLFKLVMDKTKDGVAVDNAKQEYDKRKSYYIPTDEIILETKVNNVKMFKHAATNTDLKWTDIPDFIWNTSLKEIEEIDENEDVVEKMKSLNVYMSRFLSSSKTLNKVLSKELSHKDMSRTNERGSRLGLGDQEPKTRYFVEGFGRDRKRFEDNQYLL